MLSKKMAFSLTSLITIFALAFAVTPAMAEVDGPTVKITAKDADPGTEGVQVVLDSSNAFMVTVTFSDPVTPGLDDEDAAIVTPFGIMVSNAATGVALETQPTWARKARTNNVYETTVTVPEYDHDGSAATPNIRADIRVYVAADNFVSTSGTTLSKQNQAASAVFKVVTDLGMPGGTTPYPVRITRLASTSGFMTPMVSGPFDVKIVLSEEPKDGKFTAGHIGVNNGSVGTIVLGGAIARYKYLNMDEDGIVAAYGVAALADGTAASARDMTAGSDADDATEDGTIEEQPQATGAGAMFYRYKVTIIPDLKKNDDVVIFVKDFEDNSGGDPPPKYRHDLDQGMPKSRKVPDALMEGKEKLTVKVDLTSVVGVPEADGKKVDIPNGTIIPAGGYLIVAKDDGTDTLDDVTDESHQERTDSTYIIWPGDPMRSTPDPGKQAAQHLYHMVKAGLPYNLEGLLARGGTIDLIAPAAGVKISEIMWATDAGSANRQWIEIHNTSGAQIETTDYKLMFYSANETLPDMAVATNKVVDRVSTLYKGTNYWSIAGRGQSGRTVGKIVEEDDNTVVDIEIVPTDRLISMERVMDTAGMYADGTMSGSWAQSMPPSSNFEDKAGGLFVGSPGASPINPVADPVPAPEPTPAPVVPPAMKDDIMITEIMVDTGAGRLPQWIELNNVSMKEVSLTGWSLEIENAAADADAIGRKLSIDLMGTLGVSKHAGNTGQGQSLLLVSWAHRSSSNLQGNTRIVDVSSEVGGKGRYKLISDMGFMITLVPPQTTGILTYGDMAGNLDAAEAWEIPMSENGRSSLIRREMLADGTATMGTDANGWSLASSTTLTSGPATWYGSDEDSGTPGYDAGGPLPVELSHFRPARDKATGAAVITWSTQSELNNAGFFIKRSQQRNGQFQVINATMIAGAGTASEKQFYTYTDTTAQPNVVYYYQIEDVSLDGQRQTLTRGIRLKGHVGAAGKATTLWGELKSSNE